MSEKDADIISMDFPDYVEEYPPFPDVKMELPFAEGKEEVYRRNRLIAAEEQAKQLAEEEKKKAERKAELENMYLEAAETNRSPGRFRKSLGADKKATAVLITAIAALIAILLVSFAKPNYDEGIGGAAEYAEESEAPLVSVTYTAAQAESEPERMHTKHAIASIEPFEYEGESLFKVAAKFTAENIGDKDFSLIERDIRLRYGMFGSIEPFDWECGYTFGENKCVYIPQGEKETFTLYYAVDGDRLEDISGFVYKKHTDEEYAENAVNSGYIHDFELELTDEEKWLVSEKAQLYSEAVSSAAEAEEETEAVTEVTARQPAVPFEEEQGAVVYNTGALSFKFAVSSEPIYIDSEYFADKYIVDVSVRNLTADEYMIIADNFYVPRDGKKDYILSPVGYDESTTYFTSWSRWGDSEEWTRSPIAFGFDNESSCRFTLVFSLSPGEKLSVLGYDRDHGWGEAKAGDFEFMPEDFEVEMK